MAGYQLLKIAICMIAIGEQQEKNVGNVVHPVSKTIKKSNPTQKVRITP